MRYLNITTLLLPGGVAILLAGALMTGRSDLYLVAIGLGILELLAVAADDLSKGSFALDYIAFLAMALAAATGSYLAGAVIALMYTGGEALEVYASRRAEASLASLLSRIPKTALVKRGGTTEEVPLARVTAGMTIVVRTNELVPLDGTLLSDRAVLNLANLTGEPLPETVTRGIFVKSGSVNAGEALELEVSGTLATSTYAKIVDLVKDASAHQAPFVRLAGRANLPFTFVTLFIATAAYLGSGGDLIRLLAVLVIATPCPLIIAAPVAFIGGLSKAAGRNIIVKTPAALEAVARVTTVYFDKTGTLTLGEPQLVGIDVLDPQLSETEALTLAAAIEFHSIHPTARAVSAAARARGVPLKTATDVTEVMGSGVSGVVEKRYLSVTQAPEARHKEGGISLLLSGDGTELAVFHMADVLKDNAKELINGLKKEGLKVAILTGDRKEHAEAVFAGLAIDICADCSAEEKYRIVEEAKKRGETVAMVGDGLNDAPALAKADVGIVFSGTENSASIEAADVAILGRDVTLITELFAFSKRSVEIAGQSVYAGIGLSTVGMLAAAFGLIAPVEGALLQEAVDVTVILNALRAAF